MNEQAGQQSKSGKFLIFAGSVLIVTAVTMLLLIALLVYQIFYEPDKVLLVQYLIENIKLSDKAFYGHVGGSQFFINLADPVKYFFYLLATVIVLSIVTGIFRSILSAGMTLIKLANNLPGRTETR